MLVGGPHAKQFSSVLYVVSGGASSSVESFSGLDGEAYDAALGIVSGFYGILGLLLVSVVSDDPIVSSHFERSEALVDFLAKSRCERVGPGSEGHSL